MIICGGGGAPRDSAGSGATEDHGVAEGRTRLSDFTLTFHFHALEKEMATHSSVLAWRIPGTAEPGGLPSMGSHRVGHKKKEQQPRERAWPSPQASGRRAPLYHPERLSSRERSALPSRPTVFFLVPPPFAREQLERQEELNSSTQDEA